MGIIIYQLNLIGLIQSGNFISFCRQICELVFVLTLNIIMIISSLQEYSTIQHVEKESLCFFLFFFFLAYCWFMSIWVFWLVIGCLYLDSAGLMQQLYLHGSHWQVCPEHMLQPGNAWLYIIFASQVSDSLTLIRASESDT